MRNGVASTRGGIGSDGKSMDSGLKIKSTLAQIILLVQTPKKSTIFYWFRFVFFPRYRKHQLMKNNVVIFSAIGGMSACVLSLAWAIFCSNACCDDYADDFHIKFAQFSSNINCGPNDWDFIFLFGESGHKKTSRTIQFMHDVDWIFSFQKKKVGKKSRVTMMNCSKLFKPRIDLFIFFL